MKILIVDDDMISRELLRSVLEESGFTVFMAENGAEAIEIYERERIRFVITDWEMPEMSGIDLCRHIRRRSLHGYVYLILLTGRGKSREIVEGMSAGADDFIVKPFNGPELLVRIRAGERILSLETRELLIFALAKLAESRDPETGKHLERVQNYSRLLARAMASMPKYLGTIDDEFVHLVYQTSPLHDIGKVGIPDSILLKPGRFSDDEFELMKAHTTIGAETLDAALAQNPQARFLQVAREIAAAHHERYDGRGYPLGLAGEEIPLSARIVAVADVYDALTSKRVYKEAFAHHLARNIILKDSGTHFDPDVVDAFLAVENDFIEIRNALFEGEPHASRQGSLVASR
ncbi:MAG: rpfG 1 [Schlesneria sp.]|nr:rpfG 1 [Schlesneria sp.]